MTKILVTTASKHGATAEIGDTVADRLRARGHDVDVLAPEGVHDVAGYGAIVLGSAVYAGRWRKTARDFVARLCPALTDRQVWLFSSGPLGDPLEPNVDPVDVSEIQEATGALDHRLFGGKLELSSLSFGERAIVAALRAPFGDYRPFADIEEWADSIAAHLSTTTSDAASS